MQLKAPGNHQGIYQLLGRATTDLLPRIDYLSYAGNISGLPSMFLASRKRAECGNILEEAQLKKYRDSPLS